MRNLGPGLGRAAREQRLGALEAPPRWAAAWPLVCYGCYGCNGCNGCSGSNGCSGCNGCATGSGVAAQDRRLQP
jgi:hypothetical protein